MEPESNLQAPEPESSLQVAWLAYLKGHDDGVADEREGLTEGKDGVLLWATCRGFGILDACPWRVVFAWVPKEETRKFRRR